MSEALFHVLASFRMRIKHARITPRAKWFFLLRTPGWPPRRATERALSESERERKHVAPYLEYRVFGGNVGAEREQLGYRTCQSECTRAHEERLAFLVPRIPLVPRINVSVISLLHISKNADSRLFYP